MDNNNPYNNNPYNINPYGNQQPNQYQQNPYGNQQPNQYQQNPYGNQQPNQYQQDPYGNQQPNQYQQSPYGGQQSSQYQQSQYSPNYEPVEEEGKTLGILSIIFGLFIPFIGLILGIVGAVKAKKNKNTHGPMIINIVGIGISSLILMVYIVIIIAMVVGFKASMDELSDAGYDYSSISDTYDDDSDITSINVIGDDDKDKDNDKDDKDKDDVIDNNDNSNDDTNITSGSEDTSVNTSDNTSDNASDDSSAVYSDQFDDSDESYPNAYTPSYDTVTKGDETLGYIDVPATYMDFYETGGYSDNLLAHQQYAYGMYDIVTHFTYSSETIPNLEGYAAGLQISLSASADTCTVYNATFGENSGFLVVGEYSDGCTLRAFIFKDGNGNVQYLCVEGLDDEYSDVYRTVFCNYKATQ